MSVTGIKDRFQQLFSKNEAKKEGSGHLEELTGVRFFGWGNSTIENNELIFSIISRLANTMSSLPIHEYQNYKEQNTDILRLLTISPNANVTGSQLINNLEVSRNEHGDGYALIERDVRFKPVKIWNLPYGSVTPMVEKKTGLLWFNVTGQTKNLVVPNSDMIHVKHISGPERLTGISPLDVLKGTMDFDSAVQKFSMNEMSKMDAYIVDYDTNVDEEKRKQVIDDFKTFIHDNGGVLFSEPGVTVKKQARDFVPSDLASTDSMFRIRVANAFDTPVSFLNDQTGQGYASNEQLMTQFVQMTLVPVVKQYESQFTKLLTPQELSAGWYFKFNVNALLRGDTQSRTALYTAMIRNGIATPNDLRRLEDLPPSSDKHADQLWISGDLYPIDTDLEQRKGVKSNGPGKEKQVLADEAVKHDRG
ncbi:phage portal protein [Furfurilactobacillus entadae]|uniref:phage portal protein n=1 Tax=Furfurilactobacillus entadae TaxID=2922307 RepID=UPI0035E4C5A7